MVWNVENVTAYRGFAHAYKYRVCYGADAIGIYTYLPTGESRVKNRHNIEVYDAEKVQHLTLRGESNLFVVAGGGRKIESASHGLLVVFC